MKQDIEDLLKEWEYEPGNIQARMIECSDGREVLQMRVDLGILQMELHGRPDGSNPEGFPTYYDYLQEKAKNTPSTQKFVLSEEECQDADREFVQYYHRRICWLSLQKYEAAIADANHTLAFMDFVRDHGPDEDYVQAHEQYRGFVIFQRTQAAAALELEKNNPEKAIDEIKTGLEKIREFFVAFEAEEELEDNPMVLHLQKIESSIREQHKIEATLQEQLAEAVANENYEAAAKIRDAMKQKGLDSGI